MVLKDVFDFSLEEIAELLGTTVGAVKTALHRGRGKLADDPAPVAATAPVPGALDAFCAAFNAGDIDRLTALLLDTAVVDVVGATTQYGPEAARRTVLFGMLFGFKRLADPQGRGLFDARFADGALPEAPPRVEARLHRGRWVLLHWYKHVDGDAVRAITTLELDRQSRGAAGELLLQRRLSRRRRRRAERPRARERPSLVGPEARCEGPGVSVAALVAGGVVRRPAQAAAAKPAVQNTTTDRAGTVTVNGFRCTSKSTAAGRRCFSCTAAGPRRKARSAR